MFTSSTAISIGISAAIALILKGIQYIATYNKKIIEAGKEAQETINEINTKYQSHTKTINEVKNRYAELAQGVNISTNENVNLSNDEYDEFLSISKQLLDIFPQLYNGMDDNGNAMLNLAGNTDTIIYSLEELISKERELNNIEIVNNIPKVFDGLEKEIQEYENKIKKLKRKSKREVIQSDASSNLGVFISRDDKGNYINDENGNNIISKEISTNDPLRMQMYEEKLQEYKIPYKKKQLEDTVQFEYNDGLIKAALDKAKAGTKTIEYEYDRQIKLLEAKITSAYARINSITQAWINGNFMYNILEEPIREIADAMVSGLDFQKLGINNKNDMEDYIENKILFPLYSAAPEVQNSFSELFNMKGKLQNGEITEEEFSQYSTNMFNKLVEGMDIDTSSKFKEIFMNGFNKLGVEGDEFETIISNLIQSWIDSASQNKVTAKNFNFFDDSYQESINKYKENLTSLTEWQTEYFTNDFLSDSSLYDIKVKFGSIFDFSDFDKTNDYNKMFSGLREAIENNILNPLKDMLNNNMISEATRNAIQSAIGMIRGVSSEAMESISSLEAYSSSLNEIKNSYNTVKDAIEEYKEQQFLSVDTLESLLALDDKYISILFDEKGQLQLNKKAYQDLLKAKVLEMKATIERESVKIIDTLIREANATKYLKEEVVGLNDANWNLIDATYEKAKNDLIASAGGNLMLVIRQVVALDKAKADAKARMKLVENTYNNIDTNFDKMMTTYSPKSESKSKKEANVNKFSDIIDWTENSVNNLSYAIDKLNQKLNNNTLTYNQRKKIIKDLYSEQKKLYLLEKNGVKLYKNQYNQKLNLLGSNKGKYQSLIESNNEFKIEDFKGENREKIFNAIKDAQDAWRKYQEELKLYKQELDKSNEIEWQYFENNIKLYDNRIYRKENAKQDFQNILDLKEAQGKNVNKNDYQSIIDINNGLLYQNRKKRDKIMLKRDSMNVSSEKYTELNNELQEVQNNITALKQEQIELNRKMLKLPIQQLEKEKKLLEDELKIIEEKSKKITTSINTSSKYIGNEIEYYNELKQTISDSYDAQIKVWQNKINALNETNDAIKQQIALEKAQYEYKKAINNKSVKIYREGVGFVYEADQDAIRESKQNLDQEMFNKQINSYEAEIKLLEKVKEKELLSLDNEIKSLETYKNLIDDIFESYENMINLQILSEKYGEDVLERLTAGDLTLIDEFRNDFIDIESDKDSTEKQIEIIDKNIEKINTLADDWNGAASTIINKKKEIDQVVSDNSKEVTAIQKRIENVKELAIQWEDDLISIKEDLDLFNEKHSEIAEEEKMILDNRLENIIAFAERAKGYLDDVFSKLNEVEKIEQKIGNKKKNIIEDVNVNLKDSNKSKNNKKDLQMHSGMELGFVGEKYSNDEKEKFRYVALNDLNPDEVPKILQFGESVLTTEQQGNIMNNLKSAFISGTRQIPNINIPMKNTTAPNSISFNGDIVIEKVNGDVDEFARKVKTEFLSRLNQQLYK